MKLKENKGELIIFRTKDGEPGIQVRFEEDTVWLTQKLIGELFEKDSDTVGLHLKNIYAEGELDERALPRITRQLREILWHLMSPEILLDANVSIWRAKYP